MSSLISNEALFPGILLEDCPNAIDPRSGAMASMDDLFERRLRFIEIGRRAIQASGSPHRHLLYPRQGCLISVKRSFTRSAAPRRSLPRRRERERAAGMDRDAARVSIAHEIKQTIVGDDSRCRCGLPLALIARRPISMKRSGVSKQIIHAGHRAGAVIDGNSGNLQEGCRNRAIVRYHELIGDALALVGDELQKHRVLVQAEPNEQLPRVKGDRSPGAAGAPELDHEMRSIRWQPRMGRGCFA